MNTDDFQAPPPGRADSGLNAADRWADEPQTTFASPSVTVESAHKAMAAGSSTTNATATDALATGSAGEHHTENPWGSPESVPSDHEGASDTEDQVDWAQEEDERRDEIEWMEIYDKPTDFEQHNWKDKMPTCLKLHYDLSKGDTRSIEVFPRLRRAPRQREDPQRAHCQLSDSQSVYIDWALGEQPTITSGSAAGGSSPISFRFNRGESRGTLKPVAYELRKYKAEPSHKTWVDATIKSSSGSSVQAKLVPVSLSVVGSIHNSYVKARELGRPETDLAKGL